MRLHIYIAAAYLWMYSTLQGICFRTQPLLAIPLWMWLCCWQLNGADFMFSENKSWASISTSSLLINVAHKLNILATAPMYMPLHSAPSLVPGLFDAGLAIHL